MSRPASLLVLLSLLGCRAHAPARDDVLRASFHRLIAADRSGDPDDASRPSMTLQAATSCGEVATSYADMVAARGPAWQCLATALTTCTPARVDGASPGIDSGPFPWTALVAAPIAGAAGPRASCHVLVYEDVRSDGWGPAEIRLDACAGVTATCAPVWREQYEVCRRPAADTGAPAMCVRAPADWVTSDGR